MVAQAGKWCHRAQKLLYAHRVSMRAQCAACMHTKLSLTLAYAKLYLS